MKKFQVFNDEGEMRVRVVASTRAGFMSAAIEGMFALSKPLYVETDPDTRFAAQETERDFSVKGEDFPSMLVEFLNEAWRQGQDNEEAYIGLRLSLITDKQADGAFLGQPVTGWANPLSEALNNGFTVEKNQLGYWEAMLTFKA